MHLTATCNGVGRPRQTELVQVLYGFRATPILRARAPVSTPGKVRSATGRNAGQLQRPTRPLLVVVGEQLGSLEVKRPGEPHEIVVNHVSPRRWLAPVISANASIAIECGRQGVGGARQHRLQVVCLLSLLA